jgi:hypothetical protein
LLVDPGSFAPEDGTASTIGESPLGGLVGEEAVLPVALEDPVAFDAGPPEVNGKGGKLNGFDSKGLLASDPSRPGNAPLGVAGDDPELSLVAGPIDSVSAPESEPPRPGKVPESRYQSTKRCTIWE